MMSKVLLIFFVVISWYVAGMVHSFALMLYAVCLTSFMLAMHFVTSIYKKRVSFAFASDYASAVEGRDYLVRVNINNNHGLPVSKIRLDIEVSYGFNGNKTKCMLTKKIYGSCHKKKDSINFTIRMPYAGPACVYTTISAALAIDEPFTLTIASVSAPFNFASSSAAFVSAVSPDWLTTMTSVCS